MHAWSPYSFLTLCDPMDCSLPGSSVHRDLRQEFWSGSLCPPPGNLLDLEWNPYLMHYRWILHHWANREAHLGLIRLFFFFLPKSWRTMRFVYKSQFKRFTGYQINQLKSFNKACDSLASPLPSKHFFMSGNEKPSIFLILWDLNLEGVCMNFHFSLQNSHLCMCVCMYELMSSCDFVKYTQ